MTVRLPSAYMHTAVPATAAADRLPGGHKTPSPPCRPHPIPQMLQAECELAGAEEQLQHLQRHVLQAQRELEQLRTGHQRACSELLASSSWALLAEQPLGHSIIATALHGSATSS